MGEGEEKALDTLICLAHLPDAERKAVEAWIELHEWKAAMQGVHDALKGVGRQDVPETAHEKIAGLIARAEKAEADAAKAERERDDLYSALVDVGWVAEHGDPEGFVRGLRRKALEEAAKQDEELARITNCVPHQLVFEESARHHRALAARSLDGAQDKEVGRGEV